MKTNKIKENRDIFIGIVISLLFLLGYLISEIEQIKYTYFSWWALITIILLPVLSIFSLNTYDENKISRHLKILGLILNVIVSLIISFLFVVRI